MPTASHLGLDTQCVTEVHSGSKVVLAVTSRLFVRLLFAVCHTCHTFCDKAVVCLCYAASIEQSSMGILVQYLSLPTSERDSPRIGAFNTVLDDADGALTRCDAV